MLSRCEAALPSGPLPLALHEEQIVTVTRDNSTAHFDFKSGEWNTDHDYLKSQSYPLKKSLVLKYPPVKRNEENPQRVWIGSFKGCLVAIFDPIEHRAKTNYCGVLQRQSQSNWKTICRLSETPLESAAVVGDNLFVLAGGKMHKITIPEEEPVRQQNADSKSIPAQQRPTCTDPEPVTVTKPPFEGSTLHVVKDTLFTFGGRDKDNQPTSDVLRYNPDTDSWESAGYMRSARYNVAMATVQQNDNLDVMAIGGSFGSSQFVMRPRMKTGVTAEAGEPTSWENLTSIVEKCAVE